MIIMKVEYRVHGEFYCLIHPYMFKHFCNNLFKRENVDCLIRRGKDQKEWLTRLGQSVKTRFELSVKTFWECNSFEVGTLEGKHSI